MSNPAVAARVRQLAAQAKHRRAIAEFHARRAADQQARLDALLLEAIAGLASLLGAPGPHPRPAPRPQIATGTCRNVNTECCRFMCKHRGR
jgi:plasmid stabilization system protein ParE